MLPQITAIIRFDTGPGSGLFFFDTLQFGCIKIGRNVLGVFAERAIPFSRVIVELIPFFFSHKPSI
jgi:hypothetical protein